MNLERSTLERKDRSELATIAEMLGRKPTSRARKSDIVDLILELTGVTEPSSSSASDDEPASEQAEQGNENAADNADGSAADDNAADDNAADDATPIESVPATNQNPGRESRGNDSRSTGGSRGGQSNQSGQGQRNTQNQPAQNQPAQNKPASSDPEWAEGEGDGNSRRRRRRRGRDRDRDGVPEATEETATFEGDPTPVDGLLDLRDEGYGFLRVNGFLPGRDDVYVSVKQCRQLGLRRGDHVSGAARPAGAREKNPALLRIDQVNGQAPETSRGRPRFEDLTALYPDVKLTLEHPDHPGDITSRIIDLIAPIGKGQRGLIVSPPKAGKTMIMRSIAQAIERNHPDVHLMMLLVDERPEEVTDMRRSIEGEVIASTFDRPAEEHTAVAELTLERAKRLVEYGQDVVIILDGITRLARAYNLAQPPNGRIMSGGLDTGALYPPKRFFGAARNVEEGGSLTILATALVDTGSKMDEVIFEEFKGTGNMELRLDRRSAEKRVFPAIDIDASSTRKEELLFEPKQLNQVWKLRKVVAGVSSDGNSGASLELIIDRLRTFRTNAEFLTEVGKARG